MWKWILVGAVAIGGVFYMMLNSGVEVSMGGESAGLEQHAAPEKKPEADASPSAAPVPAK
jgi:hypothetical protein